MQARGETMQPRLPEDNLSNWTYKEDTVDTQIWQKPTQVRQAGQTGCKCNQAPKWVLVMLTT
jgi:hypothetical protein